MLHEPFGPHGAEEETEELWTDLSEVPETAYEQDPKRRINSDTDMPFDPSLLPTDPGLGEGRCNPRKKPPGKRLRPLARGLLFYWSKAVIPG